MKRNLAVILSMALSLAMAGCGASASSTGSTTAVQSTDAATSTEDAGMTIDDDSDPTSQAATEADISLLARLQELTDNNVISQETLDAIIAYIEANNIQLDEDKPGGETGDKPDQKPDGKPDGQSGDKPDCEPGGNGGEKPDNKPNGEASDNGSSSDSGSSDGTGSSNSNTPAEGAAADNDKPGDAPQGQKSHGHTLLPQAVLEELLDNSIITQEEYDAIAKYQQESASGADEAAGNPGDAPDGKPGEKPDGAPGMPGGASAADISYVGATTIAEDTDTTGETYSSETADESALIVESGASVTLTDVTVTKTGDSDGGDSCNFYGLNAGVLAKDGATLTISGGTITTDAKGANGVFSYGGNGAQNGGAGDGTTVNITGTTIKTSGDGAGGIMTTGGGVTYAKDLTIETSGQSSAAIRTDRGGGTVVVDGGSYTTSGLGSPAIYSTADITVSNATLTSNQSEGVCIEGKNSITLTDCDFTVNNTKCNGHATFFDSIMIYQSMSGDADSGTSSYTMTGGSLTSKNGHVFHVTNTNAVITLSGVTITNEDDEDVLLSVCDDGWSGAENIAALNASAQTLSGKILVGDNSKLTLNLSDNSSFTGSIGGQIKNSKGETVSTETGDVEVTLDSTSTWTLTADSYVTAFNGDASQIISNGYKLYVNGTALSTK